MLFAGLFILVTVTHQLRDQRTIGVGILVELRGMGEHLSLSFFSINAALFFCLVRIVE